MNTAAQPIGMPAFAYQGIVVAGQRKCLGEFSLRHTCRGDFGHKRFIGRSKDYDDVV